MFLNRHSMLRTIGRAMLFAALNLYAEKQSALSTPQDGNLNWGLSAQGFQISLRFARQEFGNEEPIKTVIVTRNISERTVSYYSGVPHFARFIVVDEIGKRVLARSELNTNSPFKKRFGTIISNPGYITLKPGEQHEEAADLRKLFDLPAGNYTVSVVRTVPLIDDPNTQSEVMSGNASLKVGSSSAKTGNPSEAPKDRDTSKLSPGQPVEATPGIDQKHVAQTGGQVRVEADASPGHQTEPGVNFPAPPVGVAVGNGGRASRMYFYAGVAIVLAMLPFVALLMRGRKSKRVEDSQK